LRNKQLQKERKVVVDVCSLVREVASRKSGCPPVPEVACDPGECHAVVEKGRLANVLAHLIDNAQQATPEDGSVNVDVTKNDSVIVIRIVDNGHGMDSEFVEKRLFKPFDTTKGNAGMGIGMYECREFIRELGGEIHVESEPDKGTAITLRVPSGQ